MKRLQDSENLWKHFFKFNRTNYNPYMERLVEYPDYILYDKEFINSYKGEWQEYFGNKGDLYLELGSGSGNFTIELARRNPTANFLAVELRFKRLHTSARKATNQGVKNIAFVRRFGEAINEFIGSQELAGAYINFPEPWDHKKSNRLLKGELLDSLALCLKKNGKIFFKTDHDEYFQWVLDIVASRPDYKLIESTTDLHKSEFNDTNIMTEFENLFLHKHQKNINYLQLEYIGS